MPNIINSIFAFVAIDSDGHEGIMAFQDSYTNMFMPMIGADMKRVDSLREMAERIKEDSGIDYEIRYFVQVADNN